MSATALDSSVTLDEVFTVVATKRVPLAPELAGYLALELAEHADPSGGDVDPKSVFVGEEGTVALVKPRREGACGNAEESIRAALGRLLEASGSQTPALAATSKRKSGSGLRALADELEAALIPVNRAAARRALARLAREVKRVTLGVGRAALPSTSDAVPSSRRASSSSLSSSTPPPPRELGPAPLPRAPGTDGEGPRLGRDAGTPAPSATFAPEEEPTTTRTAVPEEVMRKATPPPPRMERPSAAPGRTATGDDEPPPTTSFRPSAPSPSQADIDSLIANFGVSGGGDSPATGELKAIAGLEPTPPPPPLVKTPREGPGRAPMRATARSEDTLLDPRQLPTQPSKLRQRPSLPSTPASKSGGSRALVALGFVAIAAGTFAVWRLRPTAAVEPAPQRPEPSAAALAGPPVAACRGTLVVTDVPPRAEVLLREGQAPVDVERMPVGARLEFVATAEGFAPKRVVVPTGATWDATPEGKPRLEVAVQLDKSHADPGTSDAWPASEPGSSAGGAGLPGTVHVVATPRGAEVWLLAGLGPEARVEQVSCNEDVDVLLAGPGAFRKRLHITPSDFVPSEAAPSPGVARVSAR